MSFLDNLLEGAGKFISESSYTLIVVKWIRMPLRDAGDSIIEFIQSSPDPLIKKMDEKLLEIAATNLNHEERKKSIKLYVIFKMEETERYNKFKGFPP
jgi:hypothetical protein